MAAKPSYSELEVKVEALEHELAGHHSIEKLLWEKQDQLFNVLDSLEAIVYVADMQSYEILFANLYTEKLFGHITGKICWQALQSDMTGPCPFCKNKKLITPNGNPKDTILWEMQNTSNNRWYSIRDRAINWFDGRVVHLQIAVDFSDRKEAEAALQVSEEKFRTVADFTLCSTVIGKQERTSIIISNTYEMGEFWRSAYEYQVDISVFRMRFGAFILSFFRMIR